MLVVIEGGDAAGKQTITTGLAKRATAADIDARLYSFPRYYTPLGKQIGLWLKTGRAKEEPLAFQAMMTVDRYEVAAAMVDLYNKETGLPLFICDRWWQSGFVYGAALGVDRDFLYDIHKSLPVASLNVLLDVSVIEAEIRRPEKQDSYEKDRKLRTAVREGYQNLWGSRLIEYDPGKWLRLDGSDSPKEIEDAIWSEMIQISRQAGRTSLCKALEKGR